MNRKTFHQLGWAGQALAIGLIISVAMLCGLVAYTALASDLTLALVVGVAAVVVQMALVFVIRRSSELMKWKRDNSLDDQTAAMVDLLAAERRRKKK